MEKSLIINTVAVVLMAVIAIAALVFIYYDGGTTREPTPTPTPDVTVEPSSEGSPTPTPTSIPVFSATPYRCDIYTHIEPLPYCTSWSQWWLTHDIFSEDGNFAVKQWFSSNEGISDIWFNYSKYVKNVNLQFDCYFGKPKTGQWSEQAVFINVSKDQMDIVASDPDLVSELTEKSFYVWCEDEEPRYSECFFSYSADKSNPISCKNNFATKADIWIFALTKDDTKVAKVDFFKNGTFYRTELNPPYDFQPSAGFYRGKNGTTLSVGMKTTFKNGSFEDTQEMWRDGFIIFDIAKVAPTPTPTPTPAPVCGDTICNGAETCATCPSDCGVCPPSCGDNDCNGDETCWTCAEDCGECPTCDCCQWCAEPQILEVVAECEPLPINIDGINFACIINSGGLYECTQAD